MSLINEVLKQLCKLLTQADNGYSLFVRNAQHIIRMSFLIVLVLILTLATHSYAQEVEICIGYVGISSLPERQIHETSTPKILLRYYGEIKEQLHAALAEAVSMCESALSFVEAMLEEKLSTRLVVNWVPKKSVFSANVQLPSTINIYSNSFEAFGVRLLVHELAHVLANQLRGSEKNIRTRFIEEMFADGLASTFQTNDKLTIRSHYQTWLIFKVDLEQGIIPLISMLIGNPESIGHSPLETLFYANSFGGFIADKYGADGLKELYLSFPSQHELQSQTLIDASSAINMAIQSCLGLSITELESEWREHLNDVATSMNLSLYREIFSIYYFGIHKPLIASGRLSGLINEGLVDVDIISVIRELSNELERIVLDTLELNRKSIDDYSILVQNVYVNFAIP